ncbi:UNVERIFIED_ORG: putative nucleotidyltransferase [Heyndrickxia coagulans]
MYGLLERDMQYILQALKKFNEIECAILFGSRATGNYKNGSDVDIAIRGEKVTDNVIFELNDLLNEVYPIPYFFDILHYEEIHNEKLLDHIDKKGIVLYQKRKMVS